MISIVFVTSLLAVTSALIICPPKACDGVEKKELNCLGSVRQGTGWCGCTDSCAKLEGESCHYTFLMGVPNTEVCDSGLVCRPTKMEGSLSTIGTCVKSTDTDTYGGALNEISKRDPSLCDTRCRMKSHQCTTSFVIYNGQWFGRCDMEGMFLPEQCDNTGHCFCVDKESGEMLEGSKVYGSANCA